MLTIMGNKWLVVDIDGTIADIRQRKYLSVREFNDNVLYEDIIHTYSIDHVVDDKNIEKFFEVFLSDKYMHTDKPIEGAAESLQELSNEYNIVYLTGRHDEAEDSMKNGTLKWLEEHGFPVPNDEDIKLFMKSSRKMKDVKYKQDSLNDMIKWGIRAGIGNNPSDHKAYTESGIYSIIIDDPELRDRVRKEGIKTLKSWDEIKRKITEENK